MSRLRILLLAPDCNPEEVSMPYVTYSHAAALAQLHDVALVVGSPSEDPVRRAKAPFRTIEVVRMPLLERIYAWSLRRIFKYNYDTQVLTAFGYPFSLAFEWHAWRQLRRRIFAGEFDVVLRIMPMTAVVAESFRFLPAQGAYTLRDRSAQWRFALASRLSPAREPKGMDLQPAESVSISAFRSLHLSPRGSDHSRFVPDVFRVCRVWR